MIITNLGVANTALSSGSPVEAVAAGPGDQNAAGAAGSQGYSPSPELVQLIQSVKGQPEIRADRVQTAAARLREGYYHTPASAANTAAAMLSALD